MRSGIGGPPGRFADGGSAHFLLRPHRLSRESDGRHRWLRPDSPPSRGLPAPSMAPTSRGSSLRVWADTGSSGCAAAGADGRETAPPHFGHLLWVTPGLRRLRFTRSLAEQAGHWTVMSVEDGAAPGRRIFARHFGQTAVVAPGGSFEGSSLSLD